MKRRQFLKSTIAAGTAVPVLAGSARGQSGGPQVRWRLVSSFPKSLDTVFGTAELIARLVSEATASQFTIQTFAAGEIVPGLQALDAAGNGTVECAHTPTYLYIGKDPVLAFGTGIPFGLNARHAQAWWMFAGGAEIVNAALAKLGVVAFPAGNSGCQMGGWFRKEIRTVDDLKGLKFRIAGLGGQVLTRLGAVPQQIAAGDVYPALERGTIDAAEFVGPYDDEKLGLSRIAKFYYYPGWWEGGAMMHLTVNRAAWDALPAHFQAVLRQACDTANTFMLAKYDAVNAPALKRLVANGTQLRPFPIPVLDACFEAAQQLYAEIGAKNPMFQMALDSQRSFAAEQLLWWQVAENFYDSYMVVKRSRQ